jgi:REP element-mobilizing transposase RayT
MEWRQRKLNRLPGYDYSSRGWYFVTICTKNKGEVLGKVENGVVFLNDLGKVAVKFWKNIVNVFKNVELDEYVVMPDHVHGIIKVGAGQCMVGAGQCMVGAGQCPARTYGKLSKIINGYKNVATKEIRKDLGKKNFEWKRSFYDEIIRDEIALKNIRKYIKDNPVNFVLKSKKSGR